MLYQRFARSRLEEALRDTPVVVGPWTNTSDGKSTLARMVGYAAGYEYIIIVDFWTFLPLISQR
jgi:hypothetical protein